MSIRCIDAKPIAIAAGSLCPSSILASWRSTAAHSRQERTDRTLLMDGARRDRRALSPRWVDGNNRAQARRLTQNRHSKRVRRRLAPIQLRGASPDPVVPAGVLLGRLLTIQLIDADAADPIHNPGDKGPLFNPPVRSRERGNV